MIRGRRATIGAILALFALAALPARAGESRERLRAIAGDIFSVDDVERGELPRRLIAEAFAAAGGSIDPVPGECVRDAAGAARRTFSGSLRTPVDRVATLLSRLENRPHPFVVEHLLAERDADAAMLVGHVRLLAMGFPVTETATEEEATRTLSSIEERIESPPWGPALHVVLQGPHAARVRALAISAATDLLALGLLAGSRADAEELAAALAADATLATSFERPVVRATGPGRFAIGLRRRAWPLARLRLTPGTERLPDGAGKAPVPATRAARADPTPDERALDAFARSRLWTSDDLRLDVPSAALTKLFPGMPARGESAPPVLPVILESVSLASTSPGALSVKLYEARVRVWWDELPRAIERVPALERAAHVASVDLHEVAPPNRDYAKLGKRVLRFQGVLGVEAMGYEPEGVFERDAGELLESARRFTERGAALAPVVARAIAVLPPQVFVERLFATERRLEVRLAGIREGEAWAYGARLADQPEIGATYGEPSHSRIADTFVILFERKGR